MSRLGWGYALDFDMDLTENVSNEIEMPFIHGLIINPNSEMCSRRPSLSVHVPFDSLTSQSSPTIKEVLGLAHSVD